VLPIGLAVRNAVGDRAPGRPELSRAGSVLVSVAGTDAPIGIDRTPESYRISYRIEVYQERAVRTTTDTLEVRRPFQSRLVSKDGSRVLTTRASRLGALAFGSAQGPISIASAPVVASADLRFDPALAEAVDLELVELREQRRVAERRCQVVRFGSTISSGELRPVGSREGEYADACIDAEGLLLEEVWVKDGVPLQRRIATAIEVDPSLSENRFTLASERELTTEEGNGFFRRVQPDSSLEGLSFELPEAPAGFVHVGRFAVQTPRLSLKNGDPLDPAPEKRRDISQVDAWTNGPDLLLLSTTIGDELAAAPEDREIAKPVDLGDIGEGLAVLDLRSNEVRVELAGSRFLRLAGTVPRDSLVALARTLRPVQGTGVVEAPAGPPSGSPTQ
jgi:hypothetical protein